MITADSLGGRAQYFQPAIHRRRAALTAPGPVRVRGEQLSEIWWRGRQWAVTQYGIGMPVVTQFWRDSLPFLAGLRRRARP
jgi:hypothetical protein